MKVVRARRVKDESRRNRLENEARLFHQKLCLVQETRLEKREIERILADQRLLDRRAALEKKDEARSMQHHVCNRAEAPHLSRR